MQFLLVAETLQQPLSCTSQVPDCRVEKWGLGLESCVWGWGRVWLWRGVLATGCICLLFSVVYMILISGQPSSPGCFEYAANNVQWHGIPRQARRTLIARSDRPVCLVHVLLLRMYFEGYLEQSGTVPRPGAGAD